ncbi:MAG: response regulator, partial [Candidatus Neomarinimicrobiota bacterium]
MAEATILLVDDEPLVLRAMARTLGTGYRLLQATDGAGGLEWLGKEEVAVILADQRMPGLSGDAFLKRARSLQPEAVRILITGYADIQAVVRAVNDGGIYFYVEKPWEPEELRLLVANAVEHYRLQRENRRLVEQLKQANQNLAEENRRLQHSLAAQVQFDHIVGESPAMQAVFQLVKKVIPT